MDSYFKYLKSLRKESYYKMKHNKKKKECTKGCVKCKCNRLFKKLKNNYKVYKMHSDRGNVVLIFGTQLDQFEVFLRNFMGDKGMLITDTEDSQHAMK